MTDELQKVSSVDSEVSSEIAAELVHPKTQADNLDA